MNKSDTDVEFEILFIASAINDEIDNTLGIAIKDICFEKCTINPKKDLPDYLSNL